MPNNPNDEPTASPVLHAKAKSRGIPYVYNSCSLPTNRYSLLLFSYFRCGWAFLVPYLAVYLLYAWLKWPVNPAGDAAGVVKGINGSVASFPPSVIPCLLYVYWFLHAVHVILAAVALITWWQDKRSLKSRYQGGEEAGTSLRRDSTRFAEPSTTRYPLLATLPKAAPWVFLALIFYIPGLYLEWPSDPWEHLRRINEWHAHTEVLQHSSWYKSSYFLPYTLTGHTTGLTQLSWLNFYYTAVCLLLSWQYYRLARVVGLGERASFIFVLLNTLTFGNNIFSFYRYYGLSSSIFAQIGAIALTRVALEILSVNNTGPRAVAGGWAPGPVSARPATIVHSLPRFAGTTMLLLPLIAFNHIQGIGIAGLGILAAIVWRLIERNRVMLLWLAVAAVVLSIATVLWFPRHPALDEVYHPQGWLTEWYGFNFFSLSSPTFERSLHIIGAFGVFNLGFSLWLIVRKNHVAGWLTLMPVIALALPCFALPFAHVLAAQTHPDNIITFHRFLFAVPMGLALMAASSQKSQSRAKSDASGIGNQKLKAKVCSLAAARYSVLCVGFAGAVLISPGKPSFNRLWQSIQTTPDDLNLNHFVTACTPAHLALAADSNTLTITSPLGGKIQEAFSPSMQLEHFRQINTPMVAADFEQYQHQLAFLLSVTRSEQPASQSWQNDLPSDTAIVHLRSLQPRVRQLIVQPTKQGNVWIALGGYSPVLATASDGATLVSNADDAHTFVFNSELIPIKRDSRYLLSCTLRQTGSPSATNYLAVAWYDKNGKLLESTQPAPEGAGSPAGWANGTYSYYGLLNQPAQADWTTYTASFGLGEVAAIPAYAAFIRIGALLNYQSAPNAKIQIKDMSLWQKPGYIRSLLVLPKLSNLHSPNSLAARLSSHWAPQKVAEEYATPAELLPQDRSP